MEFCFHMVNISNEKLTNAPWSRAFKARVFIRPVIQQSSVWPGDLYQ